MHGRSRSLLIVTVTAAILACAAFIPDYNARGINKEDKVTEKKELVVELLMKPWVSPFCDDKKIPFGKTHFATVHIRVNQHNTKDYKDVYVIDNGHGVRFKGAQSVGGKFPAGVGQHKIEIGLYTHRDGKEHKVVWRRWRVYTVKCCHTTDDKELKAEVF